MNTDPTLSAQLRSVDESWPIDPDEQLRRFIASRASAHPVRRAATPTLTAKSRIVTGVVAFAVFILAAGFAWRSLRPVAADRSGQVSSSPATVLALTSSAHRISAPARDLAASGGWVWAAGSRTQTVDKIDPSTGEVVATIALTEYPGWIAGGANELWVGLSGTEITAIVGIDTATNQTLLTIDGVTGPMVQTSEGLWAFEYRSPEPNWMVLLDPQTGGMIRHVEIGPQPMDIAASGDAVWTLEMEAGTVRLIGPTDQAQVVTDRSSGTFLASDASGVYLGAWRQSSANDQFGPGTSAFAGLDGQVQPVGDIYNFRPMVVLNGRVWFIAGPHDGDLSGLCGMRTDDGVVDECADISVGLEGMHDPVTYEPGTSTLWAISGNGSTLSRVEVG